MRKKTITLVVFITLGILVGLYTGYKNDIFVKEGIILINSENKISWSFKNDYTLKDGYFVLYRNNNEIYRGNKLEYLDTLMEDNENPEKIKNINVYYKKDKIILDWDSPVDNGSDNNYNIFLVNKHGRRILKSNEIIYNYKSGKSKYIVNVGENIFETNNNVLALNRDALDLGTMNITIIVLDKKGNKSEPKEFNSIRNFSLDLVDNNNKLTIINPDKEQDYSYKIWINDKDEMINIENIENIDYNNIFKDLDAPDMPIPSYYIDDTDYVFYWDVEEDIGTDYNYFIEGLGSIYNNKVYSKEFTKTSFSNLSGYYYKINKKISYMITNEDIFTKDTLISINDLEAGNYYFHIASVDNSSNISIPYSYRFTVYSKDKLRTVDSFLVKDETIDERKYDSVQMHLAKLPDNIINIIKSQKTKIYITNDDLTARYFNLTGIKTKSSVAGLYEADINKISLITQKPGSIILHEVGHLIDDYLLGNLNDNFYSENDKDFVNIFNKEKTKLYFADSHPCSSEIEYFAETFSDYFEDPYMKSKAPLTYNYIDKIVKNIK